MNTPPSPLNAHHLDILPHKVDLLQNDLQFIVEPNLVCGRYGATLLHLVDMVRCFLVLEVHCAVLFLVNFASLGAWISFRRRLSAGCSLIPLEGTALGDRRLWSGWIVRPRHETREVLSIPRMV